MSNKAFRKSCDFTSTDDKRFYHVLKRFPPHFKRLCLSAFSALILLVWSQEEQPAS